MDFELIVLSIGEILLGVCIIMLEHKKANKRR